MKSLHYTTNSWLHSLPTEYAKNQIEHEETSDNDQWNEENPNGGAAKGVVGLKS